MASESPPFWWQKPDWRAVLLWPVSLAWGPIAARRARRAGRVAFELPVISVATLAFGATGRTMIAMELARAAARTGRRPGILVSGPQGASSQPHMVDPHHDLDRHVGGEALELARSAPTIVCSDALAGARALAAEGRDLVIVADGRMTDTLSPDRVVVVAGARRGLGNGFVVPAGPVRAPLTALLAQAHVVVRLGEGDGADRVVRLASRAARPVIEARTRLAPDIALDARPALAFGAIGDNEVLFEALRRAGVELAVTRSFPDGHHYAEDELADLLSVAEAGGLRVLTTRRDLDRVRQSGNAGAALAAHARAVVPEMSFEPVGALEALVQDAVTDWRIGRGV